MTIQEIYNLAIKMGIKADPRGENSVLKQLKREKEFFSELNKNDKEEYDKERLTNPYSDTRILNGNGNLKVKSIFTGIDIDTSELLLADNLIKKGKKIDLIISHHPSGSALIDIADVVDKMQADMLEDLGIPESITQSYLEERVIELKRMLAPLNAQRVVDNAKILDMPLMCTHTIADNLVYNFINKYVEKNKPETLKDLINILKNIPEYKIATKNGVGPKITNGIPSRKCGKISFGLAGGTNGSKDVYERLSHAGYSTIVDMHMTEDQYKEAKKAHLNIIIAGHIASDSLGMNLFLDQLEFKGIKIIPCSGLIRVKRINN